MFQSEPVVDNRWRPLVDRRRTVWSLNDSSLVFILLCVRFFYCFKAGDFQGHAVRAGDPILSASAKGGVAVVGQPLPFPSPRVVCNGPARIWHGSAHCQARGQHPIWEQQGCSTTHGAVSIINIIASLSRG